MDLALLTLFFSAALLAGQATLRDLIINFLLPFLVTGCICLRTLSHRRDTVCYAALPLAWPGPRCGCCSSSVTRSTG